MMNPLFDEDQSLSSSEPPPPPPPPPPAPDPPPNQHTSTGHGPTAAPDRRFVSVFTVTDGQMPYLEPELSVGGGGGPVDSRGTSPDSGTQTPSLSKDVSSQTSLSIPPESESASTSDISNRGVTFSSSAVRKDKHRKDKGRNRGREHRHRTSRTSDQILIEVEESSSSGIGSSGGTHSSRYTDEERAVKRSENGRARTPRDDHRGHRHDKTKDKDKGHRGHHSEGRHRSDSRERKHRQRGRSKSPEDNGGGIEVRREPRANKSKPKSNPSGGRHNTKQDYPRPAKVVLTDKKYPELIDRTVAAHRRKRACHMTILLLGLFIVAAGTIVIAVYFTVLQPKLKEKAMMTTTTATVDP